MKIDRNASKISILSQNKQKTNVDPKLKKWWAAIKMKIYFLKMSCPFLENERI